MRILPNVPNRTIQIDDQDFERVSQHTWATQRMPDGRIVAFTEIPDKKGRYRRTYLHRFIAGAKGHEIVYHKDGDSLNNQRANLGVHIVGKSPRMKVRKADPLSNPQYIGVHYVQRAQKKFRAIITVNGDQRHLGMFETAEQAAMARDEAAYAEWGEYAQLNFPEDYLNKGSSDAPQSTEGGVNNGI